MKQPVFFVDDGSGEITRRIARWVQERIPNCLPFEGDIRAIGFARGGRVVVGVVYTEIITYPEIIIRGTRRQPGGNAYISIAVETRLWATPEVVSLILSPPFLQWGCNRVTAVIDKKFTRSRKLAEGVGFKLEGVVRQVLPGSRDAAIYGLLREDFLGGRFGPQQISLQKAA